MEWIIAPKLRADVVGFTGLNLSGERKVVEIYPYGGRQGDFPEPIRSCVLLGSLRTRFVFCASGEDDLDWEQKPWRAFILLKGTVGVSEKGMARIRVPDIELLTGFDARRTDPEMEESYSFAATLAEGTGWTFGRPGALKGKVRTIRVDRLP